MFSVTALSAKRSCCCAQIQLRRCSLRQVAKVDGHETLAGSGDLFSALDRASSGDLRSTRPLSNASPDAGHAGDAPRISPRGDPPTAERWEALGRERDSLAAQLVVRPVFVLAKGLRTLGFWEGSQGQAPSTLARVGEPSQRTQIDTALQGWHLQRANRCALRSPAVFGSCRSCNKKGSEL